MKKAEFEPLDTASALSAVAGLQLQAMFGHFSGQAVSLASKAQDGNRCPTPIIKTRRENI